MLAYHEATATLLNHSRQVSPLAVTRLDQRERTLGIHLLASVREWYSLEGAVGYLQRHSNADHPVPLAELGRIEEGHGRTPDEDLIAAGLLLLMIENQSSCRWAVRLDGTDDPPVLVQEEWPGGPWRMCAERFSTFVYALIWDGQTWWGEAGCRVEGGGGQLTPPTLALLRRAYREGPHTFAWPAPLRHRFESTDGRRRILIDDDEGGAYSYWVLWGTTGGALRRALKHVWAHGALATNLRAIDDECAEAVLRDLRG